MQTANLAIIVLLLLDTGILVLANILDRKLQQYTHPLKLEEQRKPFVIKPVFEEYLNKIIFSKGGILLLSLLAVSFIIICWNSDAGS